MQPSQPALVVYSPSPYVSEPRPLSEGVDFAE
jgi:hypothetical protein